MLNKNLEAETNSMKKTHSIHAFSVNLKTLRSLECPNSVFKASGKSTGPSKITFNIAQIKPIDSGYAGMIVIRYVKDEAFRNYVNRSLRPPWL